MTAEKFAILGTIALMLALGIWIKSMDSCFGTPQFALCSSAEAAAEYLAN